MESRGIADFAKARGNLFESFKTAASEIPPVENDKFRLELSDVDYDDADDEDADPDKFGIDAQKAAIYDRRTLGKRLRGTYRMTDLATGQVTAEKRKLLAVVPRVNDDGTVIYRGSRVAMSSQHRIKPALYARVKKNEELETAAMIQSGTGSNHRYILNPETGIYYLNVGHSRVPLAGVLQTLGATDDQIREAWGDDLADVNLKKKDPKALSKVYERVVPRREQFPDADDVAKGVAVRLAFAKMRVDPWSMKRTTGIETDRLDHSTILAATKKVLGMARGEQEGDDRDHLAYQAFHSIEDLIPERVRMDKNAIQRKYLKTALRLGHLDKIPTRMLQPQIEAAIYSSGLGVMPDYANPLDALDRATRLTKMGEGAIGSTDAVPSESRDVHASQHLFVDPTRSTESTKVGVDVNLTADVRRDENGHLRISATNARTGLDELLSAQDLANSTVSMGNTGDEVDGYVGAVRAGREDFVRSDEVDYSVRRPQAKLFSHLANMLPFKSAMAPNRVAMGSRFVGQSIPLKYREAPLIQSAVPDTDGRESFDDKYGSLVGAIRSKGVDGFVTDVAPNAITVKTSDGERKIPLHANTPLGSKTGLTNRALVKVGERVQDGQLVAASNFTDDNGTAAMGRNARIAFMPWRDNFEDAYTVSTSFAKKMTSEHLYRSRYAPDASHLRTKSGFVGSLPSEYTKDQIEKMDDTGVIRIGQRVRQGDPLILAAAGKYAESGRVHRQKGQSFKNSSLTWEHEDDGEVADVFQADSGDVVVAVKAESPMKDGDKLADRHGAKGIVRIVPDEDMLTDEKGQPYDIVSSDLGLISRQNPSRAYEAFLGKAARKRGQPYKVDDFDGRDLHEFVQGELDKQGVESAETVIDPTSGRRIPKVGTGELFMMKLVHSSESKTHARSVGRYGSDETPSKGSDEGGQAKRLSGQELGALVAHGAYEFMREGSTVRGQSNPEYWARYMNGVDPPSVKEPFVYSKFLAYLRAAGVDPVNTGKGKTSLMLMSDRDTMSLSGGREVRSGETMDFNKNQKAIPGGLFDPSTFGEGDKFGVYQLAEPIPHPLLEDTFRKLMGVTKDKFRGILAGKDEYKEFGTGSKGISRWLRQLDVGKELQIARRQVKDSRKTKREEAILRVRYLRGLSDRDIDPSTLMVRAIPILPPVMRPISQMSGSGTPLIDGMNLLYADLIDSDKNLRKISTFSDDVSSEKLTVYDAAQAAYGLREPIDPELRQKQVTGLLKRIVGKRGPKSSMVQRKLLSGTVDVVGRGVAAPSTKLSMDEVGIPEEQAWSLYKLQTIRELRRRGTPLNVAVQRVEGRDKQARDVLVAQMEKHPVVISRSPVLHKFGIMAFRPKIVSGSTLQMNPFVHSGYNLDHDGDTLNFHAILGEDAAKEATEKLLPSRMLLSPRDFKTPMFVPTQDHALGLFLASTAKPKKGAHEQVFATLKDASQAFRRGEIDISTPITVLQKK